MIGATNQAIEAVWRVESARVIAGTARLVRDVGLAEELAQDALVAALDQWPSSGVPDNPGAWLVSVAKRRAIDLIRRRETFTRKLTELGHMLDVESKGDFDPADADLDGEHIADDLLRLIFVSCHPVLSTEARVALSLRLVAGLSTSEIARGFLVPESTVAQRIVRAKRTLAQAEVPFETPDVADRATRLDSVLEVVYLVFNEGYTATGGDDWMRPTFCAEALRLGRMLTDLVPDHAETHGLMALMELQTSRLPARSTPTGDPVLLLDQDRTLWNQLLIRRGLTALERANELGPLGPYGLQASIAACHAEASGAEHTDWPRIAALYARLSQLMPSPVVELNRAVAISMMLGPAAGLTIVDELVQQGNLNDYHLLPSVRGDLLLKLGRLEDARSELERAAALTLNSRERDLLLRRAAGLGQSRPISREEESS